jgi:VWFA-related protein
MVSTNARRLFDAGLPILVTGLVTLAASASGGLRAQDPQAPIRVTIHTVPVYATVTDARGEIVTDLRESEVEVTDNGKRQPLTVFKSDVQPIALAILVDGSPSLHREFPRMRDAITAFAGHLRSSDRACLGTFSQVVTLNPTLTDDPAALLKHFGDEAPYPAGTALWDAIDAGRRALTAEPARHVILVVTDAQDNCSRLDSVIARLGVEQDGAMVYAVGIRGLEGVGGEIEALTRSTGGWYFELKPADDAGVAMARVADELHRQYAIGFNAQVLDNRTHRIEVKVTRPGLVVRARRTYVASALGDVR